MIKEIDISVGPDKLQDEVEHKILIGRACGEEQNSITHFRLIKRSIDSRKPDIKIHLRYQVYINENPPKAQNLCSSFPNVSKAPEILIIGAGPAGLFAALKLIELNLKPIVLERGKDIHSRKKDIAQLNRNNTLNTDSNYCFGEGGAGTFSDGKLYTRSNKRGNIPRILQLFAEHGAPQNILYDAHPHIGTDLLPTVIENIRKTIIEHGGEIYFESKVEDIIIENHKICGVITSKGQKYEGKAVILATGHSARDIYYLLDRKNILMEFKPFAMGIRVEHPQQLINQIQYHSKNPLPALPAASYSLVQQIKNRGVFSFCMCPGGTIVPAATGFNEIVVNGMSNSKHSSPYANSGIAVQILAEDMNTDVMTNPLSGLHYQERLEKMAWQSVQQNQVAPAQRLADFIQQTESKNIPSNSYYPGTVSISLHKTLPKELSYRLREAFKVWGGRMRNFVTNEAVVLGVESRTSSPVRIPRNPETGEHIKLAGLYPCGEGAGYAGGIVSSAMDGEHIATLIAQNIQK